MEEIDIKEMISIFWQRKFDIFIILLIFLIIGAVYSYTIVIPKYSSYTTVLLTTTRENDESITQTDLTLNSNLVSTYGELIKSNVVLRKVINELNIENLDEEILKKNITVSAISDTEMIKITVLNENSSYSKIIANKIAEVFRDKIEDIYKINNVYVVDEAEEEEEPCNINHIKDLVIFGFVGLIIACAYVFLVNILDTTIKSEADIESLTGLMVLASIPEYDVELKGGKK